MRSRLHARQLDGKFHAVTRPGTCGNVGFILLGRQQIRKDHRQLYFPKRPSGFDVSENTTQTVDVLSHFAHFPQATVHCQKLPLDRFKGLRQARVKCGRQLFVNRVAHGFQRLVVGLANCSKLSVQRRPHIEHCVLHRLIHLCETLLLSLTSGIDQPEKIHKVTALGTFEVRVGRLHLAR